MNIFRHAPSTPMPDTMGPHTLPVFDIEFTNPAHLTAFSTLLWVTPTSAGLGGHTVDSALKFTASYELRVKGSFPKGAALLRAYLGDGRQVLVPVDPTPALGKHGLDDERTILEALTRDTGENGLHITVPLLGKIPNRVSAQPPGLHIRSDQHGYLALGMDATPEKVAAGVRAGRAHVLEVESNRLFAAHTLPVVENSRPLPKSHPGPVHAPYEMAWDDVTYASDEAIAGTLRAARPGEDGLAAFRAKSPYQDFESQRQRAERHAQRKSAPSHSAQAKTKRPPAPRTTGTISKMHESGEFGFIGAADGSEVFLHVSQCSAFSPAVGMAVAFGVVPAKKGPRAVRVELV